VARRSDGELTFEAALVRSSGLAKSTELARCLHEGWVAVKFAYAGQAAALHARSAELNPSEYDDGRSEHEAAVLLRTFADVGIPQLCDVGVSNGIHTRQLLEQLQTRGIEPERVLGTDFDPFLLNVAERRLAENPVVSLAQWDLEAGPSDQLRRWRAADRPVLVTLLGGTLGNLRSPERTLRYLAASVLPGDRLCVGVFLREADSAVGTTQLAYADERVIEILVQPLLEMGIPASGFATDTEVTDIGVTVSATLVRTVDVGDLTIHAGHRVILLRSRRYEPAELELQMARGGWQVISQEVDGSHAVAIAARADS
jgi:L-histidine Nalpha-methyltransferase